MQFPEIKLYMEVPEGYEPILIQNPVDVVNYVVEERLTAEEHFYIFHVDTKHRVIGLQTISQGLLDMSLIHPREVFKGAIHSNAAGIILMHNHPSGDTSPSTEDLDTTRKLMQASRLIGIPILDHIIIGYGMKDFSFRRELPEIWD